MSEKRLRGVKHVKKAYICILIMKLFSEECFCISVSYFFVILYFLFFKMVYLSKPIHRGRLLLPFGCCLNSMSYMYLYIHFPIFDVGHNENFLNLV